jgi:hypothetical protein
MKGNKKISRKREEEAAEQIGGRAHPASGAMWYKKSDFSNAFWNIEDKFTHEDKYSIKLDILNKIEKESLNINKTPALRFGFYKYNKNYIVIEKKYFHFELDAKEIIITKNSYMVHFNDLNKFYIESDNIGVIQLTFPKKIFYMLTWEDFLDYMNEMFGEYT